MFSLRFELDSNKRPISGFDMGHMTVSSCSTTIQSRDVGPRCSMMLFLSLVELLDGLRRLLTSNLNSYEFIGADSSFALVFQKLSRGRVQISHGGETIAIVQSADLARVVYDASKCFWDSTRTELLDNDPVVGDVDASLDAFRRCFT